MHMEVRALFGRFVWRGVNIDDPQSILPEVRGSIPHWSPGSSASAGPDKWTRGPRKGKVVTARPPKRLELCLGTKPPKASPWRRDGTAPNRKIPATRWFGHMSRIFQERLARQVLLATTTGKQLRGRRRTRRHDYISDLTWAHLGVDREELFEIAVDRKVFRVPLALLPRDLPQMKNGHENEWVWTLKLSIYKFVFIFLPKVDAAFKKLGIF